MTGPDLEKFQLKEKHPVYRAKVLKFGTGISARELDWRWFADMELILLLRFDWGWGAEG